MLYCFFNLKVNKSDEFILVDDKAPANNRYAKEKSTYGINKVFCIDLF